MSQKHKVDLETKLKAVAVADLRGRQGRVPPPVQGKILISEAQVQHSGLRSQIPNLDLDSGYWIENNMKITSSDGWTRDLLCSAPMPATPSSSCHGNLLVIIAKNINIAICYTILTFNTIANKKVLCEHKRHTDYGVSSTPSAGLSQGGRVPTLDRREGYLPWMGEGYLPWTREGYLPHTGGRGTYLGWGRGIYLGWGRGTYLGLGRVTYLRQREGYLPWMGEGYLPWTWEGYLPWTGRDTQGRNTPPGVDKLKTIYPVGKDIMCSGVECIISSA